ncbi:hypothetical protein XELAEV_180092272mg, partial [Xenopus laevis]
MGFYGTLKMIFYK